MSKSWTTERSFAVDGVKRFTDVVIIVAVVIFIGLLLIIFIFSIIVYHLRYVNNRTL